MTSEVQIEPLAADAPDAAAELLTRFFAEEGFPTPPAQIARNIAAMLADPMCWSALATVDGTAAGVVTVTTMRYVEWGLLGEIGDLYVLPERRGMGIASALVAAGMKWCRGRGCAAVSVVITTQGQERHDLARFYARLGFRGSGRIILTVSLG